MNNPTERRKNIFDRHKAGESYAQIAKDLGISNARANQLGILYRKRLELMDYDKEFGDVPFSHGTLNCLRRNGIHNIDELRQKITNGIERRIPLRWYIGGKYIRNIGDKTWTNEILPFLESTFFDWRKYYTGNDIILKKVAKA